MEDTEINTYLNKQNPKDKDYININAQKKW